MTADRLKHLQGELDELSAAGGGSGQRGPAASSELPDEWVEQQTDDGRTYYWNTVANSTAWERPTTSPCPAEEAVL